MSSQLITAAAGLIGVVVGAGVSFAGTLIVERRRAQQERREALLSMISDALFSNDAEKAVQAKLWMSVVGERQHLRAWGKADNPTEIVLGMYRILLDVVNAERDSLGLEPLEVSDLMALTMQREDSAAKPDTGVVDERQRGERAE